MAHEASAEYQQNYQYSLGDQAAGFNQPGDFTADGRGEKIRIQSHFDCTSGALHAASIISIRRGNGGSALRCAFEVNADSCQRGF